MDAHRVATPMLPESENAEAQQPTIDAVPPRRRKRPVVRQHSLSTILMALPKDPRFSAEERNAAAHPLYAVSLAAIPKARTPGEWNLLMNTLGLLRWRGIKAPIEAKDAVRLQRLAARRLPRRPNEVAAIAWLVQNLAVEIFARLNQEHLQFRPYADGDSGAWIAWRDDAGGQQLPIGFVAAEIQRLCVELAGTEPAGKDAWHRVVERIATINPTRLEAAVTLDDMGIAEFAAVLSMVEWVMPGAKAEISGGDRHLALCLEQHAQTHPRLRGLWTGLPPDPTTQGWHELRGRDGHLQLAEWSPTGSWTFFDLAAADSKGPVCSYNEVTLVRDLEYVRPASAPISSASNWAH